VWPIEILQFLAQNLKHHPGSELGALQVEFVPLTVSKPDWVEFGWMQNLILPNIKKIPFYRSSSGSRFVCKSYDRFIDARPGHSSRRWNLTQNRNWVRQKRVVCDGKC
jgi:hypothetical protein